MTSPNTLWIPSGSYTNWVEVHGDPDLNPLTKVVIITHWERKKHVSNLVPVPASAVNWELAAAYAIVPHESKATLHLEYDPTKLKLDEIAGADQNFEEYPEWYFRAPEDLRIALLEVIGNVTARQLASQGLTDGQISLLFAFHTELQSL